MWYRPWVRRDCNEFFWFIKIWKKSHLSIRVNGEEIDFEKDIKEEFDIYHIEGVKHEIKIHAFLWNIGLGNEYSKVYYFNSKGEEVYKENTTLNKKSDNFYHSVVVQSDYFDSFSFKKIKSQIKWFFWQTVKMRNLNAYSKELWVI